MKVIAVIVLVCLGAVYGGKIAKRSFSVDQGTYIDECDQEPMELGIVLDSSRSIQPGDFVKTTKFLHDFLDHFFIGNGHDDVRVSLITFGEGIYPENGFDLDTFQTKEEVLNAVLNINHSRGKRTDTGMAIAFMHNHQLIPAITRPWADKIAVVITDGNSQRGDITADEALLARNDNITMYALGIGNVMPKELINIAGNVSRVTQVTDFDKLDSVKSVLAKKTCKIVTKPTTTTTTPMPQSACGEIDPADINFVFSPADLGLDHTAWATSFISKVIDGDDMNVGFRYGVVSGSCPDDAGFSLDTYISDTAVNDIKHRLQQYDRAHLPGLIQRTSHYGFSSANGARPPSESRKIAVLFAAGGKKKGSLQGQIDELTAQGVKVFIASPEGKDIIMPRSQGLYGGSSREQAETFLSLLCPY